MVTLEQEDLMGNLLFEGLPRDEFVARWRDEIGEPSDEVCLGTKTFKLPKQGKCVAYLFVGGLVALSTKQGWSAYETTERVEDRQYYAAWAAFCRGVWVDRVPTEEGVYPVRDLEGCRGRDRTLKRVDGKLKDITANGGFVGSDKVTQWRGDWFSSPYPRLRGAI